MASPDELPGSYFRADRGWTPQIRGLVGAYLYGDQRMAAAIVNGMTPEDLYHATLILSGLVASLLVLTPWADGCTDRDEVLARWNRSTARLVAELSGYVERDGEEDG